VAGIFLGGHESNPTPTVVPDATAVAALVGQYQARTGPILTIEARAKGLEINEPGSSQWTPLVTRADGTLDVGDWPRSQGKFYRIVRDGAGHVIELLDTPWSGRTGNDGRTHHFKRLPPFVVAAVNRAELVGDYRSSELDATYTLSDVSGTLRADSIFLPQPVELKPVVKDGFQAAGPMAYVAVERDPRGRPVALLITTNRVRNLRFDRVAGSGLH